MVLFNDLAVEQFVLLFAAVGGFSSWVMGILEESAVLQQRSLDYCRIREFLDFPEPFLSETGKPISIDKDKTHSLELRNVSFRYPGASEDTLKNINLKIHAGEKLAIVGVNGAGKTTIVKLLCGLYDPTDGEVLLDGCDIREFNRKQYYELFTAVFQEFSILPISIAENVAQAYSDDLDKTRLIKCLELADISEKVNSLSDNVNSLLNKQVNDEAVELSGGETQRLMLARALYKDAPILILDEPTAALDPIAESRLYNRYSELSAGKTSIYISHRLASTRFCDRVLLIDDGIIAETGTHNELLKTKGKYAELFEIQSKYYREEAISDVN
jgi:ATP-binding cassette subfamily B protein